MAAVAPGAVSPSGVAAAGRARVEHDLPRARPDERCGAAVFFLFLFNDWWLARGETHTRGGGEHPFFRSPFSAPVLWPLQPRRWASLEVLRERMDAVARGIHSAVIREASALVLKSFAHPAR